MKIPIKKYDPPEFRLRELIDLLTQYPASYDGSDARAIAHEYKRLLKHHEEETKFLIARVQELEAQSPKEPTEADCPATVPFVIVDPDPIVEECQICDNGVYGDSYCIACDGVGAQIFDRSGLYTLAHNILQAALVTATKSQCSASDSYSVP